MSRLLPRDRTHMLFVHFEFDDERGFLAQEKNEDGVVIGRISRGWTMVGFEHKHEGDRRIPQYSFAKTCVLEDVEVIRSRAWTEMFELMAVYSMQDVELARVEEKSQDLKDKNSVLHSDFTLEARAAAAAYFLMIG